MKGLKTVYICERCVRQLKTRGQKPPGEKISRGFLEYFTKGSPAENQLSLTSAPIRMKGSATTPKTRKGHTIENPPLIVFQTSGCFSVP